MPLSITLQNNNYNQAGAVKSAQFNLPVKTEDIHRELYTSDDFDFGQEPPVPYTAPVIIDYQLPIEIDKENQDLESLNQYVEVLKKKLNKEVFTRVVEKELVPGETDLANNRLADLFNLANELGKNHLIHEIISINNVINNISEYMNVITNLHENIKNNELNQIKVLANIANYVSPLNIASIKDVANKSENSSQYYSYYITSENNGVRPMSPFYAEYYIRTILKDLLADVNAGILD